jgi:hypothetical protein
MDIYIIYNDDNTLEKIRRTEFKSSPYFHFIDDRTRKGRKDSWKIKGGLSARLTPFVAIYEKDKPIHAIYSETGEDVIESLIKYLNE